MPTNKRDKAQQGKNQTGRSSSDQRRKSSDRVGMNSDDDDSRKGTRTSRRELEDDFELANRAGSGTGSQSGSHNTNRR